MSPEALLEHGKEALLLALTLSLPVLGVALVITLVLAVLQAATQIQESSLAHLPRLLAGVAALLVLGPWIGHELGTFAERMFLFAAMK